MSNQLSINRFRELDRTLCIEEPVLRLRMSRLSCHRNPEIVHQKQNDEGVSLSFYMPQTVSNRFAYSALRSKVLSYSLVIARNIVATKAVNMSSISPQKIR